MSQNHKKSFNFGKKIQNSHFWYFFLKIEFLDIIRDFVTECEFKNLLVHLMGNVQIAWDNKMKYVPHVSKEFVIH